MMLRNLLYSLTALGGIALVLGVHLAASAETGDFDATATRTLVTLVRSASVQADLKLDERQVAAVNAAVAEIDQPLWRLRDVSDTQKSGRQAALQSRFQSALHDILRPEQRLRLQQLRWRCEGLYALKSEAFASRLELTATQKKQLAGLLTAGQLSKSDSAKAADTEKRANALLTDSQRSRVAELLGPVFDFRSVRQVAVRAPEIVGIEGWVNTRPLKLSDLRGKVVVLHFWTFGCINCVHNLPVYKTWYDELPHDQVVMVGIHTPETAAEHQFAGLQQAVKDRQLKFPVAMDLKGQTWDAWGNSVWPAVYLIDRQGNVRYWWTGELKFNGAEGDKWMRQRIDELVAEKD